MKTAIVYYSMSGNTEYVAKKIAEKLDADLIQISPQKAYPDKGASKFFWGGKSAVMGEAPALEAYTFQADSYERVIFGFPVWASNFTPPIRSFINENPSVKQMKIAAFACQSGNGAEKAFEKLKKYLGLVSLEAQLILIDPKDKIKEENELKISEFCDKLK